MSDLDSGEKPGRREAMERVAERLATHCGFRGERAERMARESLLRHERNPSDPNRKR